MSPENFCYWLNRHLELTDAKELDSNQVDIIKDYLKLVFKKETPNRNLTYNPLSNINEGYFEGFPQASC